ncbi:MAG: hypothetical protein KDJ77_18365, partial [Rhodobiaceae bacterium]|nr:hypothetical protein [Rhodobiaceae bacterium]
DGDDWLYVDNPDTVADGGAGTDRLFVVNGTGVSNAVGSTSIEIAWGNAGDDTFDGTGAAVGLSLRGLGGDDILTGGDYDDYINGDAGADELRGGAGTDRLYVDAQDTVIDAGTGNDDRLFVTGTAGVTIGMAVAHAEIAYGNAGNDTFNGLTSTVALTLHGKSGNDTLIGGDMNDRLYGEGNAGGGDTLNGSLGNDYLFGGTNAGGWAERDQFVFDANWGDDRIFDFADNGFEKIDFSSIAGITGLGDLTITDGVGYARIAYSDTAGWDASIRVDGVHAADLGTNDFIFV